MAVIGAQSCPKLAARGAPRFAMHVVFTTPYVLLNANRLAWEEYFNRTVSGAPQQDRIDAYASHMKFGLTTMRASPTWIAKERPRNK